MADDDVRDSFIGYWLLVPHDEGNPKAAWNRGCLVHVVSPVDSPLEGVFKYYMPDDNNPCHGRPTEWAENYQFVPISKEKYDALSPIMHPISDV